MSKAKPFLKWAGGKSRVALKISSFFPKSFNDYYEPFLGSGAIYFTISPQHGLLNDLNKYLIGTYKIIKENPEQLIRELRKIDQEYHSLTSMDLKSEYYYKSRTKYNSIITMTIKKAALFIFLNKAGFNGMYRENSKGEFNIPFGKHNKCLICDEANIREVSTNIKDIKFSHGDYDLALRDASEGDLVYLDPPYIPISKTANFTQYQKEGFTYEDHIKLRDLALKLHKKGCYVIISNSSCKESEELYESRYFNINRIEVTRQIHLSRKVVPEIVVTNFSAKGLNK